MGNITLGQICDTIENTVRAATGVVRSQSFDELTEGLPAGDLPTLQVYWQSLSPMDPIGMTDRHAYQGAIRAKRIVVHIDGYAAQRSHLAEDMQATVNLADAILDVLEQQNTKPYFGLDGIKAWQLESATRGVFPYAQAEYMGVQFVLVIWVY